VDGGHFSAAYQATGVNIWTNKGPDISVTKLRRILN